MRLTFPRREISAHALDAQVLVFAEKNENYPFISLDLRIGDDLIQIFLPPHAYHRAKSIVDLWSQLVDRAPDQFPASPKIIGAVS